jgi:transposase
MASLQKYSSRGHTYYRIVESKRINGKPTPVPIMYIGSQEELVRRLLSGGGEAQQTSVRSFQHGDVAALKAIADQLGVVGVINKHVGKTRRGISVGTTLLLAAINRAVDPCSKRAWSKWATETSLHKLFDIDPARLTSQHFWNCMDEISAETLEAIEAELTQRVVEKFQIKLDLLFFDPTNFHTYIASDNQRSQLARRGRNKQKRFDLRQISIALLAARDGLIPLCSQVYQGNIPDVKAFPESLSAIRNRLERLVGQADDITLVYDKGNNSRTNQALVDASGLHFVVSLVPRHYPNLLVIPRAQYRPIQDSTLSGFTAHRLKREIWGLERTVLCFISEEFRCKQISGFEQHLNKCLTALQRWKETLAKSRTGPRSTENAAKQIDQLLSQQHLKEVVTITYNDALSGADRLSWIVDENKRKHLYTEVFGKRFLITGRHDWSDAEILKAYNAESRFEQTFSLLKNPYHLTVRPQYHWTDQKVRVHISACLIALLLSRLLHKIAREQYDYSGDVDTLLDDLGTVRLALLMQTPPGKGTRPRCTWMLEHRDNSVVDLFKQLVPNQEPFVYTTQIT